LSDALAAPSGERAHRRGGVTGSSTRSAALHTCVPIEPRATGHADEIEHDHGGGNQAAVHNRVPIEPRATGHSDKIYRTRSTGSDGCGNQAAAAPNDHEARQSDDTNTPSISPTTEQPANQLGPVSLPGPQPRRRPQSRTVSTDCWRPRSSRTTH
ncbi:unnamed protein product, partial [Hapterophycus canaliculatus]